MKETIEQNLAEQEKAVILNTMPQIVTYHDTSHRILWANRTALNALGKTVNEIVGRRCFELWEGTTKPCEGCPVDQALRTGSSQEAEIVGYHDGIWLVRGEPVRDGAGAVIGVVEIALDITKRKRDEEELRRRLRFEETVTRISTDFVNLRTEQIEAGIGRALAAVGRLMQADRSYVYLLHDAGTRMTKVHEWCTDGIDPQQGRVSNLAVESVPWGIEQLKDAGVLSIPCVADLEGPLAAAKELLGSIRVKSLLAVPIRIGGQFLGFLGLSAVRRECLWPEDAAPLLKIVAEILANALLRRRAEEALQASEEQFRSLFQNAVLGFYRTTPDGRILMANPSLVQMLGYTSFEGLASNLQEQGFHPSSSRAAFKETIESQGQVLGLESVWMKRDGTPLFVRENARAIRGRDGSIVCYEGTVEDITKLKQAENALRESEQNYREIFNAANDAVLIHDPVTGAILDVNRTMLETYGYTYEEALHLVAGVAGFDESPYSRQKALARIHQAAEEGPQLFEWLAQRKNGDHIWQEVNLRTAIIGGKRRVLAVVRDITDRKKAETQARQHLVELTRAWHANMLGEMASGLAHELNQPLCAIVNYSHGCLRLTRKDDYSVETLQGSIEQIAAQAQRAADILKRIRGLIAKREPQWTSLDLEGILANAVQMLRNEAVERNVAIISRFETNLPKIEGDSVGIEQVVLNLMKNAIEAMNDAQITHRSLTISSRLSDNHEVEVAVADTGCGISPESSERIFESFFTTKPQGLGIGLSLSRRIIEAHGGRLWAESQGRSGATFRFTLPVEGGAHGQGQTGGIRRR